MEYRAITDRTVIGFLAQCKEHGAGPLTTAPLALVLTADADKADTWIEDSSIAISFMMLMAEEQEIGSCWCQIHLRSSAEGKDAEETVCNILGIDSHMRIVGILALGIPEKRNPAHALDELNWDKVHYI